MTAPTATSCRTDREKHIHRKKKREKTIFRIFVLYFHDFPRQEKKKRGIKIQI
jgi:hypothetical protein